MPLPSAWMPWKTPVMIERELEVVSRGNRLCGSLCLPHEGSSPLVLMIHGSGPLDRNENIEGLELNIFNAIAYELAAQGIASVRYDKRGCGQSEGDYYSAGYSDLVARQSTTDTFRLRGQTYPARWFRELFALESSDLYARVGCPLLLIGGGKDVQCDPADVHRIAALVNSKARVQTFPDLTHILRSDEQVASFQRYAELLQQPVDPAVLQTISGWLAALSGSAADPVFRPRAAHQRLP